MLKITIPTPCHEDWNKMTPDQTGRHCSVCAKSVVDFTGMSDEEVKHFFLNKKADERVCGRFKQTQLRRIVIELPQNIFYMQMPLWKKFLAACLVVFSTSLFSCETKIKGKPETQIQNQELRSDTADRHMMLGGIGYSIEPDSIKTIEVCQEIVGDLVIEPIAIETPKVLQGDTDIAELQPVPPIDSSVTRVKDTTLASHIEDSLIVGSPIKVVKTKNPPGADSMNCNTIKNYN